MSREERVCLGAVVGVHGIRGEVKVKSFTEIDRDLGKYGDLETKMLLAGSLSRLSDIPKTCCG